MAIQRKLSPPPKTITAEFEVPYLAHASMEPLNCVVDLRADHCDIWTGTQFQTGDTAAAAATAGLKPEQVTLHTPMLGGGFGRRANPASDFVIEAVQVAKAAKTPVKVVWTREDDTRGGYYRPMWYDRFVGGIDEKGNPLVWTHTIVGQSIIAGTPFEAFLIKDGKEHPSWHLPPAAMPMIWEGRTPGQICRQLKDPKQNNGKTVAQIVEHVTEDKLVLWGWNPGEGRTLPPMSHGEFARKFQDWARFGAACPN